MSRGFMRCVFFRLLLWVWHVCVYARTSWKRKIQIYIIRFECVQCHVMSCHLIFTNDGFVERNFIINSPGVHVTLWSEMRCVGNGRDTRVPGCILCDLERARTASHGGPAASFETNKLNIRLVQPRRSLFFPPPLNAQRT